ncbi:MAG: PAS domain-containing protein, partial [Promethearchaeota archaeon]
MASVSENINKINQLISENIDDLVFIVNDKFKCEYNNFESLNSEKHLNDFIHPKDSKRINNFVKNVFKSGFEIEEARIADRNKIFSWYEIKGKKIADDENKEKAFLLCRNITKLKTFESEIKDYQKRYTQLAETLPEINYWKLLQSKESKTAVQRTREMLEIVINSIPQLIYWKDKELNYLGCNAQFAQINGFGHVSLIIGRSSEELGWAREKASYIKDAERRVMENMEAEYNVVELLNPPNGIKTWFEINRIPLHGIEGKVEGILVTYEDITNRKSTEQRLRESEEKFRNIAENSITAITIAQDDKLRYVNKQAADMLGYTVEDMTGWSLKDVLNTIHPDDLPIVSENIGKTLRNAADRLEHLEYRVITKSSETIWTESYGSQIMYGGKQAYLIISLDITKEKEAEQKYESLINN